MTRTARLVGATAFLLFSGASSSQVPAHPAHGPDPRKAIDQAAPERRPSTRPADEGIYRSPFGDYRGFTPQEPLVDWRGANDQVREIGGHVGLMKGAQRGSAAAGHQGHSVPGTGSRK